MNTTKCLIAMMVAGFLATPALSADEVLSPGDHEFTVYKKVAGWTIYVDHDRKSCLVEGIDANNTVVQMGLTADHSSGYVGVFTQQDVGLKTGEHDITLAVDGNVYSGKSHIMKHGVANDYQGGYFLVNNPQFLHDIEWGRAMLAFRDSNGKGVLVNLKGTHKALTAAKACQASMM